MYHNTKKYIFLLFSFIFVQYIYSQEPLSQIEKLRLGQFNSSLSLGGSSFSTEIWGRYSNNKYYPWCSVFENPAFIYGEKTPKILLQFAPAQSFGITHISGVSSAINDELDKSVASYKSQDLNIDYPLANLKLKRKTNLPEGMILFPVKKYTVGLSFHRSLSVSMLLDWVGSETSISTELNSGGVTNKVILNNYLDTANQLDYLVTSTNFIISRVLKNKYILGFQAERLYYNLNISGNWNIQGSMLYNGKEFLFNDPETLWHTDITQNLQAHYEGVGWRINWGGIYIINSNWILNGLISFLSDAQLDGSLSGNRNKIPALNIKSLKNNAGVDEILDPAKLNPSQLTLTENIAWQEHSTLKQTMPGQFKIGFLYTSGKWGFYLSDCFYFGNVCWQYGKDYIKLSPKQRINFYINNGGLYSKLGVYLFKTFSPEPQDLSFHSGLLALPYFSFGYSKKLTKQLVLIGAMGLFPIPGVNFGIQYQL